MELLIFTKDRVGSDVFQDTKLPKRGYVIDAHQDGCNWGRMELVYPRFRIVKVPAMTESFAETMLSAEIGFNDTPTDQSTLQLRAFKFDLDDPSLPADFQAFIADDDRQAPHYLVADAPVDGETPGALTLDQLIGIKVAVPAVDNPLILGDDGTTL